MRTTRRRTLPCEREDSQTCSCILVAQFARTVCALPARAVHPSAPIPQALNISSVGTHALAGTLAQHSIPASTTGQLPAHAHRASNRTEDPSDLSDRWFSSPWPDVCHQHPPIQQPPCHRVVTASKTTTSSRNSFICSAIPMRFCRLHQMPPSGPVAFYKLPAGSTAGAILISVSIHVTYRRDA